MRTPAQIAKMTAPSEHLEQVKLVTLLLGPLVGPKGAMVRSGSIYTHRWPELSLLYAIPNGGQRSKAQAGKLRGEGVQAAVPDLCLPVARSFYHSLYIELKAEGKYATKEQRAYHERLREQGHAVFEIQGADLALDVILAYLGLGELQKLEVKASRRAATASRRSPRSVG